MPRVLHWRNRAYASLLTGTPRGAAAVPNPSDAPGDSTGTAVTPAGATPNTCRLSDVVCSVRFQLCGRARAVWFDARVAQ